MRNRNDQTRDRSGSAWSGKALVAVVAWGASFAATRVALEMFTPTGLVASRLTLGAVVLLLLGLIRRGPLFPVPGDRAVCLFLGLILGAHLYIQAYGLQHTSAINTAWIIAFIPVTIALGAQWFLKQHLRRIGWLGVTIATGGVILVAWSKQAGFPRGRFGDLVQCGSCLTWTAYTLLAAGPVARNGSLRVTTISLLVALVCLWIPTAFTGTLRAGPTWGALVAVLFLGVICNGIVYYLWFRAVDEHGPTRSGAYIYLEPFISIAVARLMLGEPVALPVLLGGFAVLVGVRLVAIGSRPSPPDAAAKRTTSSSFPTTEPETP